MSYEEHEERKDVVVTRKTTRVRVGGDDKQPTGVWEWLAGLLKNPLKLSIECEHTREVDRSVRTARRIPNEQRESIARDTAKNALRHEQIEFERKALEAGRDPREPHASSPEEIAKLEAEFEQYLRELRDAGWTVDAWPADEDHTAADGDDEPAS